MAGIPDFRLSSQIPDFRPTSLTSKVDPYKAAQTTVEHNIQRLNYAGITPPKTSTHPNLLTTALDILDRPGAAVRSAVKAALTPEKEPILGEAWKGFTGQSRVSGEDVLKQAGIAPKNKVANFLASLGTEILLDPTTYLTFGTTSLAKKAAGESAETIAKRVAKEVAEETGKGITEKSAINLVDDVVRNIGDDIARTVGKAVSKEEVIKVLVGKPDDALLKRLGSTGISNAQTANLLKNIAERNIPVGRIGTAMQRALGREAATVTFQSSLPSITQTVAKREAEQLLGKSYNTVKQLNKAIDKANASNKLIAGITRQLSKTLGKETAEAIAKRAAGESAEAIAKSIKREILKETGKEITEKNAIRLAQSALKFQQKGVSLAPEIANRLLRELKSSTSKGITTQIGKEVPRFTLDIGLTKPVASADITKVVTGLRSLAAKVGGKPGEKTVDFLGRVFVRDYTPSVFKGVEREAITTAKKLIDRMERMAPAAAQSAMESALREWKKMGIPEEARKLASYFIEEGSTPAGKAVMKAQNKLQYATEKLNKLLVSKDVSHQAMAAAHRSVNTWTKKLADATEKFMNHREKIFGTREVSDDIKRAAYKAIEMFSSKADELEEVKIPVRFIQNYVHHLYTDPPEKVNAVLKKLFESKNITAATPSFMKKRLIGLLEEAKDMGLHPVEDVALTTAVYNAMADQAITIQKLGQDLIKFGSAVIQPAKLAPATWVAVNDKTIPALAGMAIHPEVAKTLERLYTVIHQPDEASKILNTIYNKVMSATKWSLTAANPSYHIRNTLGNIYLNMLDGIYDPKLYDDALKIIRGKDMTVNIGGKKVSGDTLLNLFKTMGLEGQGMFRRFEYPQGLVKQATTVAKDIGVSAIDKSEIASRLMNKVTRLGVDEDSLGRMVNFINSLRKGMSPTEAADHVRTVLYDYGALTKYEKSINRFLVPFYSWIRFNTPAMLKLLVTRPRAYTALKHVIDTGKAVNDISDEDVPTWLRDMLAFPVDKTKGGDYRFLNLGLPIADVARIHSFSDWPEAGKEVFSSLNPLVTVPFQAIANKNVFTGADISKYPDLNLARLKDVLKFALSQAGPAREIMAAQKQAAYRAQGKTSATQRIPGLGSIITTVNPEAYNRQKLYELRDLLQQFIAYKKAQGVKILDWRDIEKINRIKALQKRLNISQ